jgi:methyl-accepting chemotaxis protein
MRKMSLATRITLLPVVTAIAMACIFVYVVPYTQELLLKEKETRISHLVQSATSIITHFKNLAEKGELKLDVAQKEAMETVRAMRYDGEQYFWINDFQPRMLMHPFSKQLEGKDLNNNQDTNGKRLFVEMAKVCREQGKGFVDYYWAKPGEEKPAPKLSYVESIPGWDWIVGSGIYIDDVEKEMNAYTLQIGVVVAVVFWWCCSSECGDRVRSPGPWCRP